MRTLSLAARNLTRNVRRTLLTALAVAFGLTMMFMTINLQNGQYQEMMRQGISSMAGHVVVEHPKFASEAEPEHVVPGAAALTAAIRAALPDATVSPRIQAGGLLSSTTNSVGVGLRGVDPDAERQVIDLDDKLVKGAWLEAGDDRGIVIGAALADRLGVDLGDKVVFMGQGATGDVESRLFRVAGVFRTGGAELDAFVAISAIGPVQEVLGRPDAVHQVTVHLRDAREADAARAVVSPLVPEGMATLTWREAMPEMLAFIQMDRTASDIMMSVIGLIVGMGVLNTVLMSVLERTREFGVLLAIGMRPRQIAQLVLAEGLVLGLLGTALGALGGVLISWPIVVHGLDYSAWMGEAMEMEGIVMSSVMRAAWDPARMARYGLAAVMVTMLSAAYPAWYITRLKPVDAMRAT
jgi:ABC-type lipoprotein release transport system permease subunit